MSFGPPVHDSRVRAVPPSSQSKIAHLYRLDAFIKVCRIQVLGRKCGLRVQVPHRPSEARRSSFRCGGRRADYGLKTVLPSCKRKEKGFQLFIQRSLSTEAEQAGVPDRYASEKRPCSNSGGKSLPSGRANQHFQPPRLRGSRRR